MSFMSSPLDIENKFGWLPQGLLLLTAYHWFCDAVSIETSLQAVDVLLCIVIGKSVRYLIAS